MAGAVFYILRKEGVFLNVFLFFLIFSPMYLLDMFLVIPLALLLLHREILNLTAPSEELVTLYRIFGLPSNLMFWSNMLMISAVNLFNMVLLSILTLFTEGGVDYWKQVLVLNGALFFAVAFGNGVLYYRLNRSVYYAGHKVIIVSLFLFFVLMVFGLLFLIRDQSVLVGVMFLLIFLIWIISVFDGYD